MSLPIEVVWDRPLRGRDGELGLEFGFPVRRYVFPGVRRAFADGLVILESPF